MALKLNPVRSVLLTTVSAVAITIAAERGAIAADLADPVSIPPTVSDPGEVWVAVEGGYNFYEGDAFGSIGGYYSDFNADPEDGWWGGIEVGGRPGGSVYDFVGRVRYGKGDGSGRDSYGGGYLTGDNASVDESHIIADFEVGRNIGIGGFGGDNTRIFAGLRFAHFDADINGNDYYGYAFNGQQTFTGIGPRIGAETSVGFANNFAVDLAVSGAVLFGTRDESYAGYGYGGSSDDNPIVPNLEASAGLSYLFGNGASATIGYRFDGYWNVYETIRGSDGDRLMHGPYGKVKIKMGGN